MTTLFVICNGANSEDDVSHALNSTYGGKWHVIKNVGKLKQDKFGNTYTFVEIFNNGPLQETRMDRLVAQLRADPKNRGERFMYQMRPVYIEWTIKLHLPKDRVETPEEVETQTKKTFTPSFK
jgi:hypothetical protein